MSVAVIITLHCDAPDCQESFMMEMSSMGSMQTRLRQGAGLKGWRKHHPPLGTHDRILDYCPHHKDLEW